MPQTYTKLGQSLGDMLGGFASGNEDSFNKGAIARSTLDMHRASATKNLEEAKRLQQFNDPAQVKKLAIGMVGGNESQLPGLDTFQKTGGVGDAVFQQPNTDLEMIRPKPVMLSDPANLTQPGSLADSLMQHSAPQGRSLPLAVPDTIRHAAKLAAHLQAGGEKAATPQTLPALLAQAAAAKAIESGDMTALNVYNTLAKEGATYTPYKTDTHGRTANEGSGAVNVTDVPLHDANIGKLLADAIQHRAAAAASAAQADKHRFDMAKPKSQQEDKPMPVQAMRLQEENIDAISTAQGIKTDLSAFVNQLDSGAINLGVISNAWSGAKNFTGNSDEQSRNYQSFNATLEKLRNDSLRLNKGVQTDGDAQRAWNELLTNINDPKVVRQRLSEIQAINDRAVKIRMARNNNLRRNYGAPEMDYTPYLNQEPVINGSAQQTQSAQVVRTGTLNGRKVMQFSDGSIQYAE